jgi:hypothetical protein
LKAIETNFSTPAIENAILHERIMWDSSNDTENKPGNSLLPRGGILKAYIYGGKEAPANIMT